MFDPVCRWRGSIGGRWEGRTEVAKLPRTTADRAIRALERDGWFKVAQTGSHVKLRHESKPGIVSVPRHPGYLATGTIASIVKQAGLTAPEFAALL